MGEREQGEEGWRGRKKSSSVLWQEICRSDQGCVWIEAGNRLRLGVKFASGDLLDLHVLYSTLQT